MTTTNPIVPPPELVEQWHLEAMKGFRTNGIYEQDLATMAAQWGADQELEACIEWLDHYVPRYPEWSGNFRVARRPKPPSLKDQALEALERMDQLPTTEDKSTIRRALEALDD